MLSEGQWNQLSALLKDLCANHYPAILAAWRSILGPEVADPLPVPTSLAGFAESVIEQCSGNLALLQSVTARIKTAFNPRVDAIELHAAALAVLVVAGARFDALTFADGLPFVNRAALRQRLVELAKPDSSRRVLVVNGRAGLGKSYSARFVEHEIRRGSDLTVVRQAADDTRCRQMTAWSVTRRILRSMHRPLSTVEGDAPTPSRRARILADIVGEDLALWGRGCWIELDKVNRHEVPIDTKCLVDELARGLYEDPRFKHARLLLFDYPVHRLAEVRPVVDSVVLNDISVRDVGDHFKAAFPGFADERCVRLGEAVFARLEENGEGRLAELEWWVSKIREDLAA